MMIVLLNKIAEIVNKNKKRVAYKVGNESITYEQLWQDAIHFSEILKYQGNEPVIILGHKEITVVKSILACLIAQRTYVPVGLCTPFERLQKIVELTKATLILSDEKILLDGIQCSSLADLKISNNEKFFCQSKFAYIIFTSGSTGEPKGVPITVENLENFIAFINTLEPLKEYQNVNVLNQASFSFDLSVADFYYTLCNGHTLYAFENDIQESYSELFDIFKKIEVAFVTPTFMKLLLLNKEFNYVSFPKFKCVYFCGELLEKNLVEKLFKAFPKLNIINAYGPTEATSAISAINITKNMLKEEILPVGKMNHLATMLEIKNGEIILKGESVFKGYLGDIKGGYYLKNNLNCYKTGDMGYVKNGLLYCKGRKDSQIKYKGYRIELNDIEHNLSDIVGVKECAVIAKYNEQKTVKLIKAFVVGENISISYLQKELTKKIPNYMMPKTIQIIEKMPINANGKIDRKALIDL